MKYLNVFDGVKIPVDLASTQKYVTLAMSEAGKTYLTLKFEEQLCDAGLFFVTLDPVGKHWALRAGKDGNPEGGKQDVYVFGGQHGDLPLDPESGSLIADVVVDHPGRYVLDLSTIETNAEQDRFATAFALRLFRRKAKDPGFPLTVILEEAEDFIPQVPGNDQKKMKGAFSRIQKIGRNHGLGTWAVSQRAASLDKGFISQGSVLIAMRMSHKRDRDAIDDWVEANGTNEQRDKLMGEIASYEAGECTVWSPSWLKVFKHAHVLERDTFDSSASVKAGERMESIELAPLDVEALGKTMQEIAEKADEDDPKKLRKQIADLKDKLRRAEGAMEDVAAAEEAVKEMEGRIAELEQQLSAADERPPAVTEAELRPIVELADELAGATAEVHHVRMLLEERVANPVRKVDAAELPADYEVPPVSKHEPVTPPPPPAPRRQPEPSNNGELGKLAREVLQTYVAYFPRAATPEQLGVVLAKSSNAGPFRRAIADVLEAGYVDGEGRATKSGRALIGSATLPSPDVVQGKWLSRLSGSQREILNVALHAHPDTVAPVEVGHAIGKNPNAGPIRRMFKDLANMQVIEYDAERGVRASDYLVDPHG